MMCWLENDGLFFQRARVSFASTFSLSLSLKGVAAPEIGRRVEGVRLLPARREYADFVDGGLASGFS